MDKCIKTQYNPATRKVGIYSCGLNSMNNIATAYTHLEADKIARKLLLNSPDILVTKHGLNKTVYSSSEYPQLCQNRFPIVTPLETLTTLTDAFQLQLEAVNRCMLLFLQYNKTKSAQGLKELELAYYKVEELIDHDYIAKFDSLSLAIQSQPNYTRVYLKFYAKSLWQQYYQNYYYYAVEPNYCLKDRWASLHNRVNFKRFKRGHIKSMGEDNQNEACTI